MLHRALPISCSQFGTALCRDYVCTHPGLVGNGGGTVCGTYPKPAGIGPYAARMLGQVKWVSHAAHIPGPTLHVTPVPANPRYTTCVAPLPLNQFYGPGCTLHRSQGMRYVSWIQYAGGEGEPGVQL